MTWLEALGMLAAVPVGLLAWDALHGFRCWACGTRPRAPHAADCGALRAANQRR